VKNIFRRLDKFNWFHKTKPNNETETNKPEIDYSTIPDHILKEGDPILYNMRKVAREEGFESLESKISSYLSDHDWYYSNRKEIQSKYEGHLICIKNKKIIIDEIDEHEFVKKMKENNIDHNFTPWMLVKKDSKL
jgi:hypothetical protein